MKSVPGGTVRLLRWEDIVQGNWTCCLRMHAGTHKLQVALVVAPKASLAQRLKASRS